MQIKLNGNGGAAQIRAMELARKLEQIPEKLDEGIDKVVNSAAKDIQSEWRDDYRRSSWPGVARNQDITIRSPQGDQGEHIKDVGSVAGGPGRLGLLHLATAGADSGGYGHRKHPDVHAESEWPIFVRNMEAMVKAMNEW